VFSRSLLPPPGCSQGNSSQSPRSCKLDYILCVICCSWTGSIWCWGFVKIHLKEKTRVINRALEVHMTYDRCLWRENVIALCSAEWIHVHKSLCVKRLQQHRASFRELTGGLATTLVVSGLSHNPQYFRTLTATYQQWKCSKLFLKVRLQV